VSAALDLLAGFVLEDGRRWGEVATPWQWEDARAILEPGESDPRLHFITRPRGGSKTVDTAAMAAVALVEQIPPGGRAYVVASDRDQARLTTDAMSGLVTRTPGLAGAIRVDRFTASTTTGATLEVLAADEASSYGLRGHLYLCDEITLWANQGVWISLVSAVPKVSGARLVALGSAGDPAHWSYAVRERARTSRQWRLHEIPGPLPWVPPEALEEQRALLTDSQFARLHLNQWTAAEDRLVTVENLAAAVTLDGPQEPRRGVRYRMGLDLGLTHDATAIAVAHAEADPTTDPPSQRIVLDRLVVFQGRKGEPVRLADVEATVLALWRAYNRPRLRADPFQAAGLVQAVKARGVTVEEWPYTASRYGEMASALFALLRDQRIDLHPDDGLLDELRNVRLVETIPGQVRIQHDAGRHDDRCVAIGMAVVPLIRRPTGGGRIHAATGDLPPVRLTPSREKPAPPPVVVKAGEERPTDRLLSFQRASKHPGYQAPGRWQRP
jgi:phage terminase large subunit-like protein